MTGPDNNMPVIIVNQINYILMKTQARSIPAVFTMMLMLFSFSTLFLTTSCNKNDFVEFYSDGKWVIDKYYSQGVDQTEQFKAEYQGYMLDLQGANQFLETYTKDSIPYGIQGDWSVLNDGNALRLNDNTNGVREYIIVSKSPSALKLKKGTEEWWLIRP